MQKNDNDHFSFIFVIYQNVLQKNPVSTIIIKFVKFHSVHTFVLKKIIMPINDSANLALFFYFEILWNKFDKIFNPCFFAGDLPSKYMYYSLEKPTCLAFSDTPRRRARVRTYILAFVYQFLFDCLELIQHSLSSHSNYNIFKGYQKFYSDQIKEDTESSRMNF